MENTNSILDKYLKDILKDITPDNCNKRINDLHKMKINILDYINDAMEKDDDNLLHYYEKLYSNVRMAIMVLKEYRDTYYKEDK